MGRPTSESQSSLCKPLFPERKAERTYSADAACPQMEKPKHYLNLWRARSCPASLQDDEEVKEVRASLRPPYTKENSVSVLLKACIAVGMYFSVGLIVFYCFEGDLFGTRTQTFVDALYFSVVTLTTVGYGDIVPASTLAKLFTCLYIFVGFGLVGALLSGAANYLVEKQEQILLRAIHKRESDEYGEFSEEHDAEEAYGKVVVAGALVAGLLVTGLLFLIFVEKMHLIDAIYCVCVTVTTLGYGDRSFRTVQGRLFAALWILSSTVCVAQFFLYIAEMRTEDRQRKLAHWVLTRRTTTSDLEAADLDHDGTVSAPEFVIFKLKELGKIDEADVIEILKQFKSLDFDHSGSISISDLRLSQPS